MKRYRQPFPVLSVLMVLGATWTPVQVYGQIGFPDSPSPGAGGGGGGKAKHFHIAVSCVDFSCFFFCLLFSIVQ